MAERIVYVDGKFLNISDPAIKPLDRGFALGDGVFETMRVENGRAFRLHAHLDRLRQALTWLEITQPGDDVELEAIIREALARNELTRASVRLAVTRGVPEARGLLPGQMLSGPTVVVQVEPFAGYPVEKYATGFAAAVASIRHNESSPTAYIKSSNYLDNVLVRMAAAAVGADEGLMLNTAGNIACGSMSNVFVVREGRLRTPPISAGILAGITRACVIEIANDARLDVSEENLTTQELHASDEAFLTNSLMGVMPLTRLDGRPIGDGQPGLLTRQLHQWYEELVERATITHPV